jgi:hypothetical protein
MQQLILVAMLAAAAMSQPLCPNEVRGSFISCEGARLFFLSFFFFFCNVLSDVI